MKIRNVEFVLLGLPQLQQVGQARILELEQRLLACVIQLSELDMLLGLYPELPPDVDPTPQRKECMRLLADFNREVDEIVTRIAAIRVVLDIPKVDPDLIE